MKKYNPFKTNTNSWNSDNGKDRVRDPLDVRDLLTDNTRKAIITPDGELKLQKSQDKDKPSVELMKERYWGNTYQSTVQQQLAVETRAMKKHFPGFSLRRAEKDFCRHNWTIASTNQLYWTGILVTHGGARYSVAAVYPHDYPFGEIKCYVLSPFIPASEHRFRDGHLCLYEHDGNGAGFENGKSTAVTVIAWTAAWLHSYEIWRVTGEWPLLEGKS